MGKKHSDRLNVSQRFVLKTTGMLHQKAPWSSFSQAVSGYSASESYKTAFPQLNADKSIQNREKRHCQDGAERSSNNISNTDQNFPSLVGSRSKNPRVANSVWSQQPQQSSSGVERDGGLNKESQPRIGKSRLSNVRSKPKRNQTINIDIQSAIQVAKSKQKKGLKRLNDVRSRSILNAPSGNALDSACPIRKRGKVRLNRKPRLTSLRKKIEMYKSLNFEQRDLPSALSKQFDGVVLDQQHISRMSVAKLHNSKFREYCRNFATPELVEAVKSFVVQLREFHDRMYRTNSATKIKSKRRLAAGFHECWKILKAQDMKLIIMATNIERNEALFERINNFMEESKRQGVPVIFAGRCMDLSYWLHRKNRTCIVGIINYDGANKLHENMMILYERDKAEYELKLSQIIQDQVEPPVPVNDVVEELKSCMIKKLTTGQG